MTSVGRQKLTVEQINRADELLAEFDEVKAYGLQFLSKSEEETTAVDIIEAAQTTWQLRQINEDIGEVMGTTPEQMMAQANSIDGSRRKRQRWS